MVLFGIVSDVTHDARADRARKHALQLLALYTAVAAVSGAVRIARGTGSPVALLGCAMVGSLAIHAGRRATPAMRVLGDWLPLLALPILYAVMPWSSVHPPGRVFDGTVQGWDRSVFGTDPARTLAGALPWRPLSELLHLAYFSYYAIIYVPAFLFYVRPRNRRGFHDIVWAFTIAMVASFVVFSLYPVEGPRYAWPPPEGVPDGPVRRLVLSVLEAGSSRGTAFPSSHVANAVAIALAALRWRRWVGLGLTIATIMLGFGAIYGGFHYATDVIAGLALGVVSWGITTRMAGRSFETAAGSAKALP